MIKKVEEFNKCVAIAGFKDVHIGDVDRILNVARETTDVFAVQFFDARLIAGWQHLYFATLNALKAFKNKSNISKKIAVECLLYVSAQKQIKIALRLIGIKQSLSQIAVLIIAKNEVTAEKSLEVVSKLIPGKRDDAVLDLSNEKIPYIKKLFNISDIELATKLENDGEKQALFDLVIEHVALLVTKR